MTWAGIEKLWTKSLKRTDGFDIFPSLNKDALEKWSTKWGKQYEYLKKIVLYDAPIKYPIDVKYIFYILILIHRPRREKEVRKFLTK